MIRKILLLCCIFYGKCFAQVDTATWMRAFPITDYMVSLDDSTKVVQLELPEGLLLKDRQMGMIFGVYNGSREETVQKGYGKCYLIKGDYYYFAISHNNSGLALKKGDLLYTFMPRTSIYYGQVVRLASHFVRLQNVYEQYFYDRFNIFLKWTEDDEKKLIDSLVADIQFTGQYFAERNSSMNKLIEKGSYQNQKLFSVMIHCSPADVMRFLDYMIAYPRLYAGREWKISEIFATWLTEGAPIARKD